MDQFDICFKRMTHRMVTSVDLYSVRAYAIRCNITLVSKPLGYVANLLWTQPFSQGLNKIAIVSQPLYMQLGTINILVGTLVHMWYATLYTSKSTVTTQIIITVHITSTAPLKQFTRHESSMNYTSLKKIKPKCYCPRHVFCETPIIMAVIGIRVNKNNSQWIL